MAHQAGSGLNHSLNIGTASLSILWIVGVKQLPGVKALRFEARNAVVLQGNDLCPRTKPWTVCGAVSEAASHSPVPLIIGSCTHMYTHARTHNHSLFPLRIPASSTFEPGELSGLAADPHHSQGNNKTATRMPSGWKLLPQPGQQGWAQLYPTACHSCRQCFLGHNHQGEIN